jgi:hypothetical protein
MKRKAIFKRKLSHVQNNLIVEHSYELYDQYGCFIMKLYARRDEINKYLDITCKLRPNKITINHVDNYTNIQYIGVKDIILGYKIHPFLLSEYDQEIFYDERLDIEWCRDNKDRIKIAIDDIKKEQQEINVHKSRCVII